MARQSLRSSAATTPQKRSSQAVTPESSSRSAKRQKAVASSKVSGGSFSGLELRGSARKASNAKEKQANKVDSNDELESSSSDSSDDEGSGYEEENDVDSLSATSDEDEDADASSSESDSGRKRSRKVGRAAAARKPSSKTNTPSSTRPNNKQSGQELWRPSVKTGLGPGTQVLIEKPKPRPAGNTPYKDDTIHPNTMLFLKDLAANNEREWLKMHDPDYRTSWNDFTSFLESLTVKLLEIDETIPELPLKDVFFRIYRDIRFSSDPTPYKAHFSAAWSRTGRKGPFACYYLHLQPGKNFVGGGLWHPEAAPINAMRRNIDRKPEKLKRVLLDAGIRKEFLGGVAKDEKKVVRAFVKDNEENALKTKPKGYDADHKNIELLRLRNYTMGRKLNDDEILGPKGIERVAEVFRNLEPFVTYLNSVVMPDQPDSDSDSESNEADD